jgi:Spy/CpxP family protein refolding chaperone
MRSRGSIQTRLEKERNMKRKALIAAIAATLVSAAAWAAGPGMGFGPGGGYGFGGGMGGGFCHEQGMYALGLTAEQRDRIAAIQSEFSDRQFELMGEMRELRTQAFRAGPQADPATYAAMNELRQQMYTLGQQRRERIEAVLTPEQRAQWRPGWRGGPWRG